MTTIGIREYGKKNDVLYQIKLKNESQHLPLLNTHFLVVYVLELTYLLKEIISNIMAILHLGDSDDH